MKDDHYNVKPNQNAKQQALEVIRMLQSSGTLPIERAEMKIRMDIPVKEGKKSKEKILKLVKNVESEEFNSTSLELVIFSLIQLLWLDYLCTLN